MSDAVLKVDDLKVHFPVQVGRGLIPRRQMLKAVDGVSFELAAGETLGVVGESGCGKSTLARAILRLVHTTAGRVTWLGQSLTDLPADAMRALRQDLQVVFQDPLASLNPRMRVAMKSIRMAMPRTLRTFMLLSNRKCPARTATIS